MSKTILFFQTGAPETARVKFSGVLSYAEENGFGAKMVERSSSGKRSLGKTLDFWKPAGCIVEASGGAEGLEPEAFGGIPVVYQCHDPASASKSTACVTSDSPKVAVLAAKEFAELGLSHFAFVGWFGSVWWSDAKRDVFAAEAESRGCDVAVFEPTRREGADEILLQQRLRKWIAGLPRPCGVLAVSDIIGAQVLSACAAVGAKVPEEVAVIGVNNDEELCESTLPKLSSIRLDYRKAGRLAAELLGRAMAGERISGHYSVPPDGIVRRASSREFRRHDAEAKRAVEMIRRHACDGLMPREVLEVFGCSRRLAEIRFKAATGRTITEEIQAVRMERVRELLAKPDVQISAIAGRCGWPSDSFLRRIFRRKTGMSLREARERLLGCGA